MVDQGTFSQCKSYRFLDIFRATTYSPSTFQCIASPPSSIAFYKSMTSYLKNPLIISFHLDYANSIHLSFFVSDRLRKYCSKGIKYLHWQDAAVCPRRMYKAKYLPKVTFQRFSNTETEIGWENECTEKHASKWFLLQFSTYNLQINQSVSHSGS